MNRRKFLSWAGVGWLASSLPVAIAACFPSSAASVQSKSATALDSESRSATRPLHVAAGQFVTVGTVAELDKRGSLKRSRPRKLVVIRDPKNPAAVLALTSVCNHQQCTVDWQARSSRFQCPCHGSRFASDGRLQRGPATKGLTPLEAKLEGGRILVKA